MGWETIALTALQAASTISTMSNAKTAAKATIKEGNLAAQNKAQQVASKAAAQQVSFLNSGLTLEGTPESVINSTFNTGLQDIAQIRANANTASKNIISQARTQAISNLASSSLKAYLPSQDSIANLFTSKYGPAFGEGSWLGQQITSFGSTDIGDQMPWLSNDPNDILVGKV